VTVLSEFHGARRLHKGLDPKRDYPLAQTPDLVNVHRPLASIDITLDKVARGKSLLRT
jgi:hypothetical protein